MSLFPSLKNSHCVVKNIYPAFDQIPLARRATTQGQEKWHFQAEGARNKFLPLLPPSIPPGRRLFACLWQHKEKAQYRPAVSFLRAPHRICDSTWRALFTPSLASEPRYGLARSFYSIPHFGTALRAGELFLLHLSLLEPRYELTSSFYSIYRIGAALRAGEPFLLHLSLWSRAKGW